MDGQNRKFFKNQQSYLQFIFQLAYLGQFSEKDRIFALCPLIAQVQMTSDNDEKLNIIQWT